jgi:DNA polymerase
MVRDVLLSQAMAAKQSTSAADFLPDSLNLPALAKAADGCRGCPLYKRATQTVFGQGPARAHVMMVGEQPGDAEDRQGRPFVGPAGKLLDQAIDEAGLDRGDVYVTNAVKHFKWTPRGKRRLHAKPSAREVTACRPWLEAEMAAVRPTIVICLGATAAQSLLGSSFRVTRQRGVFVEARGAARVLATYHPSAILRAPDDGERKRMRREFVADLRKVARALDGVRPAPSSRDARRSATAPRRLAAHAHRP